VKATKSDWANSFRCDSGSAILEFLIFGVAINVALLGFGVQVLEIQKLQLAAESIARNSARNLAQSLDVEGARTVAANIAESFGLSVNDISLNLECVPSDCSTSGAIASAQVEISESRAYSAMPVESAAVGDSIEE